MKQNYVAYIDDYNEITYLISKKGKYKAKSFYLYEDNKMIEELKVAYLHIENEFVKIVLNVKTKLILQHPYVIIDDLNNIIPVYTGSIVRTAEFESEFYYDGPLGYHYNSSSTIFRIWSPVARSIIIKLKYPDGTTSEKELVYQNKGLWTVEISGDLDGVAYIYNVKIFDAYERVNDPYAIASSANGEYNYVVNIQKFYQMKYPKPLFSGKYTDAVLYEGSIRDLTCSFKAENKGTFKGLTESDFFSYLFDLGVTHFQVMPMFDFGGVDDTSKDKFYNWGYNPEQYFVPSGWYTTNPNDAYTRINELLKMIDTAHQNGIRIIMDVVYNHVYKIKNFPFEKLVPGYFYRVDMYGNYTNTSGCGNDLATEKRMCSKFIKDNLKFWAQTYHISGFRFDLMGLLDIETLNHAYHELKQIDSEIMVYGEGWNMPNTIPDAYRPHSYNHYKIPQYAFFNDTYRDIIKGSQWEGTEGYIFGKKDLHLEIFNLLGGSSINNYKFQNPNQTINYVECHDNYTVIDFGMKNCKLTEEEAIQGARLALQMLAISLGVVFLHAGQEFYRTKKGVENSYNSNDKINLYDYQRRKLYSDEIKGLKELLAIRKEFSVFRMSNIYEIEKNMKSVDELCTPHCLVYCLDGNDYILTIVVKNDNDEEEFVYSNGAMIFNGRNRVLEKKESYTLKEKGVYIFKEDR